MVDICCLISLQGVPEELTLSMTLLLRLRAVLELNNMVKFPLGPEILIYGFKIFIRLNFINTLNVDLNSN